MAIRWVFVTAFFIFIIIGSIAVLQINRDVVINPEKSYVVNKTYRDWIITAVLKPEYIYSEQDFKVNVTIKYTGMRTITAYVVSPIVQYFKIISTHNKSVIYSYYFPTVTTKHDIRPNTTYSFELDVGPQSSLLGRSIPSGKYVVELIISIPAQNKSPNTVNVDLQLIVR